MHGVLKALVLLLRATTHVDIPFLRIVLRDSLRYSF